MSDKDKKDTGKEEAKTRWPEGFTGMSRQMMSGKPPGCCGPETQGTESHQTPGCCGSEMRAMMSRMMADFQATQGKPTETKTEGR